MLKAEEIDELKILCTQPLSLSEGGFDFVFMPKVKMPPGWSPAEVDLLLCPQTKDNYATRLYFSEQIAGPRGLNWNGSVRIAERNWVAFSWKDVSDDQRLLQILLGHLDALKK